MFEDNENTDSKTYVHLTGHSSSIYNSQDMEAIYVSIHRWMDKEDVVYIYIYAHTYNRLLLSHKKKNGILPLAITRMNLES